MKNAVLAATGYESEAVELTATKLQFVVTLVNSKLTDAPAFWRESEATRIVSAIVDATAGKREFKSIQMIHVHYVKRDGKRTRAIHRIDFRKDTKGNFQHHIT